ncbi:MAG: TolC family protein [Verrucomicrobiota bacterium]|nr:TolC family protein [Limisphaera sp.]MDW8382468.1 TolC family protein [Verrucomicrobiota bacterium]
MRRWIDVWIAAAVTGAVFVQYELAGASLLPEGTGARDAAEVEVLTWETCLRRALESNPDLHSARLRVVAAEARARQARLWPNPSFELGLEEGPVNQGRFAEESKQTVGVAQTIPYPRKKALEVQIERVGVQVGREALVGARREWVRRLKLAYVGVLAGERVVLAAEEVVSTAEAMANALREKVASGAVSDSELLRAEIQWMQARAGLVSFQRELWQARQQLATGLGWESWRNVRVTGVLREEPDAELLRDEPPNWLETHPECAQARLDRDRARLERDRSRWLHYPDVTFWARGGRQGPGDVALVEAGLTLPLPLWDRGRARFDEAAARLEEAEAHLEGLRLRLCGEWQMWRQRLRSAAEQVRLLRQEVVPRAERALALVRRGFEEGKFGFLDLLDTQRTLAEARLSLEQRVLELNVAQVELEALTGRLDGLPSALASEPQRVSRSMQP